MPVRRHQLTTIERRRVRDLRAFGGLQQRQIASATSFSLRQIQYAIAADSDIVGFNRRGRHEAMTPEDQQYMVEYITSSRDGRMRPWHELSPLLFESRYARWTIFHTLRRLGFRRHRAAKKSPLSDENKRKRLAFAEAYWHWTPAQWRSILWSDESYIASGPHRTQLVTRRIGERNEPTCIVPYYRQTNGAMFWGCFHGITTGPCLFWNREAWGTITSAGYRDHIIPLVVEEICRNRALGEDLFFMQDNAPVHAAGVYCRAFADAGIYVISWPPYSPDLNPIEHVWSWMKDWIDRTYGLTIVSMAILRGRILEAWAAVNQGYLNRLLQSMPHRCSDVMSARGGHTKW